MKEQKNILTKFLGNYTIVLVMVVLFILLSVISPYFLNVDNIMNLLLQSIFVMITGFGMMFVLTIGGIDLSVGAVMGFSGSICGLLIAGGNPTIVGIIIGLLAGIGIGVINGLLITKLSMAPFLVTFAMACVIRGFVELMTTNGSITGFADSSLIRLGQDYIGIVPIGVIIACIVFVILFLIIRLTKFGRIIKSIGYNKEATRLSGISVNKYTLIVYGLTGLLSALSGILLSSRLSSVPSAMGNGYEMDAIAACVIGGTLMTGGKSNIIGTAVGAIVLQMIANGLNLLSINQFYRQVIVGIVIIFAVVAEIAAETRRRTAV